MAAACAAKIYREEIYDEADGLAERTIRELESTIEPQLTHDSSTNALIRRYRRLRPER